jgi:hypothetical protein
MMRGVPGSTDANRSTNDGVNWTGSAIAVMDALAQ